MSLLSGDLGYTTWLEVERTFRIYDLESRIFQEQSRADGLLRLVQESSVVVSSSSFSVVVAFWFLMPSSFASMNLLRSGAIGTDLEHLDQHCHLSPVLEAADRRMESLQTQEAAMKAAQAKEANMLCMRAGPN
eukprot:s6494_g1.t1